jgi:flagellar FliL protein
MATNRTTGAEVPAKIEAAKEPPPAAVPPPSPSGGLKAWLPLMVTVLIMPIIAYATTTFLLLPRFRQTVAAPALEPVAENGKSTAKAEANKAEGGPKHSSAAKVKQNVTLNKLIVNVAGTAGTRYIMTSMTLVGNTPDFKNVIESSRDQLVDLANATLSSKTIADLEKPGARNLLRTELLSAFNNALRDTLVQEIYFTELAIQ